MNVIRLRKIEKAINKHTQTIEPPICFYDIPEDERRQILEDMKIVCYYANRHQIELNKLSEAEFNAVLVRAREEEC